MTPSFLSLYDIRGNTDFAPTARHTFVTSYKNMQKKATSASKTQLNLYTTTIKAPEQLPLVGLYCFPAR